MFYTVPGGFTSIIGYQAASGEIADHTINGACDYRAALERSLVDLLQVVPRDDLDIEAIAVLTASWQRSLAKLDSPDDGLTASGAINPYTTLAPGVQQHTDGGLYVWGLAVSKRVRVPGEYRPVKSRPLTLAKQWVEGQCCISKFRRFRLGENFEVVRFGGQEIRPLVAVEVVA